jgi:lysophospholipase L1-like esterase
VRPLVLLAATAAVFVPGSARADQPPRFEWKDGDRVVLIGDDLIEREQAQGIFETWLTLGNPDKMITFRNLGWSGDTVHGVSRAGFGTEADGYRHLKEHVLALKPTVLIVGYGMSDSFDGESGLPRFKEGLTRLLDDVAVTGARVVLLAPIAHEDLGPPLPSPAAHNKALSLYRDAIRDIANQRSAWFLDLFNVYLRRGQIRERTRLGVPPDTTDGIHLSAAGYRHAGSFFGRYLGFSAPVDQHSRIEATPRRLRFQRTAGASLLTRFALGMEQGHPDRLCRLPEIDEKDLPPGRYTLSIDGRPVATADAAQWRKGPVNVSFDPDVVQAEALRQAIVAKNRLYFYRWRPQNDTYLFGFRKHEQGNNAREIPLFDPLVAEKEAEIARLKVMRPHVYELVREGDESKP